MRIESFYRGVEGPTVPARRGAEKFFIRVPVTVVTSTLPPPSPCDENGRLHAHVALQQTAAWEPFVGRAAETARSKAKGGSTFSERASVAMKWYTYKGVCADWDMSPVVFDDSESTLSQIVKCSPSASS
eukprot:2779696-Pyramimonas_sp.AAC.1